MNNSMQTNTSLAHDKEGFIRRVVTGLNAQWPMMRGVEFEYQRVATDHQLKMRYYRNVCNTHQAREILVRQFEYADMFRNCLVTMDDKNNLMIHAKINNAPLTAAVIEKFITQALTLCRLS